MRTVRKLSCVCTICQGSASVDVACWIDWFSSVQLQNNLRQFLISTFISQTFLSWVAIFHLRQPMLCWSHCSYGMPGLAHIINVLFWVRRDFHVSSSGRDMSGNIWIRPSGSSMVNMGISSNIMKPPSRKCFMTCLDMLIYCDILHWSDISLKSWPCYWTGPFNCSWCYYRIPGGFHRT